MRSERAKIFAPFNPLRGLDAAYREKERVILPKAELLCDRIEEINSKLKNIQSGDVIKLTYYKEGEYKTKICRVSAVLPQEGILVTETPIYFSDIYDFFSLKKK